MNNNFFKNIEWTVGNRIATGIAVFMGVLFFINIDMETSPFIGFFCLFILMFAVILGYLSSINSKLKQIRDNTAQKNQ